MQSISHANSAVLTNLAVSAGLLIAVAVLSCAVADGLRLANAARSRVLIHDTVASAAAVQRSTLVN